jgi:hypothetical protein
MKILIQRTYVININKEDLEVNCSIRIKEQRLPADATLQEATSDSG